MNLLLSLSSDYTLYMARDFVYFVHTVTPVFLMMTWGCESQWRMNEYEQMNE